MVVAKKKKTLSTTKKAIKERDSDMNDSDDYAGKSKTGKSKKKQTKY